MLRYALGLIVVACCVGSICSQTFPETLWVQVTYYDFKADGSNPNFQPLGCVESNAGLRPGMIWNYLDSIRKPLLRSNYTFNDRIAQWWRPQGGTGAVFSIDPMTFRGTWTNLVNYQSRPNEWVGATFNTGDPMANVVIYDSLPFLLTNGVNGTYTYNNQAFFPLDGKGFGSALPIPPPYGFTNPSNHNYSFAMEIHRSFGYQSGLTFTFEGDDDIWCFLDGRLLIDLGGIHGTEIATVRLDTLGLVVGQTYVFDYFQCERWVSGSDTRIQTNLYCGCVPPTATRSPQPARSPRPAKSSSAFDLTGRRMGTLTQPALSTRKVIKR
jgi:fibro-slime domain-containing protein